MSSRKLLLAYLILFLGCVFVDQTTKFHAEKALMVESHPTLVQEYRPTSHPVFTLGVSPSTASRENLESDKLTKNWLDFELTYLRNTGVVWGLFSNAPQAFRFWGFHGFTLIAIFVILYFFRTTHPGARAQRAGFAFILSGAIGNFIDRAMLGYVIDWLHFSWNILGWEYSFPVFNLADVFIDTGIGLVLLDGFMQESELKKIMKSSAAPAAPVTSAV
jgi:signal peptidase II